jgi:Tfp pilus assembly protein PilV
MIEILIVMIILPISLLALAGLMATTTRNTSFGNHIAEATTFAQERLEELRVTPWATITTGNDTRTSSMGIVYTRTWTVPPPIGNLRTVTITLSWNDRIDHSLNFISAIAQ